MQISEQGIALIKIHEGCSLHLYTCPAGKLTIGYGHVLQAGEELESITYQDAEDLLRKDLTHYEKLIEQLLQVEVNQCQFDALVSFCFNVGAKALEKSTLLRLLNTGSPQNAAQQFDRWIYANGRKLPGLVQRRRAEKALFLKNS